MNQEILKKILSFKNTTEKEVNIFITEVVELLKNKKISNDELFGITQLRKLGIFNLREAAKLAAIKLNIEYTELYNNQGRLIKVII